MTVTTGHLMAQESTASGRLAIDNLIGRRCTELGLTRGALARRLGFQNSTKALRRLEELCEGEFARTDALIRALPSALDVPTHDIVRAVEESKFQLDAAKIKEAPEEEAAWRAAFRPHAFIATERSIPEPIFVAAVLGIARLLRIDFNLALPAASFGQQALDGLHAKLVDWPELKGKIPAFGAPVGVVINFSPDRAVRCDLDGNVLDELPHAYRLGSAQLSVRGRPLPLGALAGPGIRG